MAKRKAKKVQSKGFEAPNNILKTLTGGVQQTLMVAALGLFVYAVAPTAQALTFETGQVLVTSDDGSQSVVDWSETDMGQAELEENGYTVGGGVLSIAVGDELVTIPVHDLAGRTPDQIREIIGEEIADQVDPQTLEEAYADEAARLTDAGIDAVIADDLTTEELVDHVLNSDSTTGAIIGATEEQIDAINTAIIDSGEPFLDPETGICHNCP